MLSISKPIRSFDQGEYYLSLASVDDYYTDGEEPPGYWLGKGASALDLRGIIDKGVFRHLFRGLSPDGQLALVHNARSPKRRAGWDLTWSVPKSVSTLWSQASEDVRRAIEDAVKVAVGEGTRYLETVGVIARRGENGVIKDRAQLVFAAFPHSTSRALDPQLHIHTILLNVAVRPDGSTGTIEPRELFRHQHAADSLFRVELAAELEQRLGLRAIRVGRAFEIFGVDRGLMDAFSKRRREIEAVLAERGLSGAKAAEAIAFETRTRKTTVARDLLFRDWRRIGVEHGWSSRQVELLLHAPLQARDPDLERRATTMETLGNVTYHESHFPMRHLIRTLAEEAQGRGLRARDVYTLRDAILKANQVIPIGQKDREPQFTTPDMLNVERQFLVAAAALKADSRPLPEAASLIEAALLRHSTLSAEQRELVRAATGAQGGLQLVSGMAGTGKSFAFRVAREIWQEQGLVVYGAALAGKAASGLQEASGIPSRTLHRFLWGIEHGAILLDSRSVVLVDEAAMVGTRQLRDLTAACASARARLVLAGDPGQLQSVEAGGGFAALVRDFGAVQLTDIQRQRDLWARDAVKDFAAGRADRALTAYMERGFVHIAPNPDAAMKALVDHWRVSASPGQDIILAGTNAEIAALNALAQTARTGGQPPSGGPLHVDDQALHVGDRVLFTRNSQAVGVFNGELGTITECDGACLTIAMDQGRTLTVNTAQYPHIRLGYALTTHKAQGMTAEDAWILPGAMQNRELTYVQASRPRGECRFFVSTEALDSTRRRMAISQPKGLAVDLEPAQPLTHVLEPVLEPGW